MSLVRTLSLSLASILALSVGACGGSAPPPAAPATAATPAPSADPACPVTVGGTSVSVEDTATGAALVFVTTSDVAELRKRVVAVAAMHNEHHGAMGPLPDGAGDGGEHAGHDMSGGEHAGHDMSGGEHAGHDMSGGEHAGHDMSGHGGGMQATTLATMIGVHSKASATEIDGGARLELVAGAGDVAKLQGELRMHAQHLATGTCAMGHH